MTQEQIQQVIKMLKEYNELMLWTTIIYSIVIVLLIFVCWLCYYKYKKVDKMHREWKSTLTEEEVKALNKSKEYWK